MAIKKKTLKNSLKAKELSPSNEFFDFKHDTIVTADSFTYNAYAALNDVMDVKTNNLSSLFLTKKQLNTDWLEINEKENPQLNLVSTISFYSNSVDDLYNPGVWLYFNKSYEFWDYAIKDAPYAMTYSRPKDNLQSYFFYIEYLDETRCRISHNFGDLVFYLGVDTEMNIKFMTDNDPERVEWHYSYEDEKTRYYTNVKENKLRLYKTITNKATNNTTLYSLVCKEAEVKDVGDEWRLSLSDNVENVDQAVLYINDASLQFGTYIDNSYVAYDQSAYITAIDRSRSAFHLRTQAMLHHQYNAEGGMNFVPLKNNYNYQGGLGRGDNLSMSSNSYPDVGYRNYNAIHSGINQEYGNNDIILNYTFTDQVYTIKDGETYEFYIPSVEENGGVEPLWPYAKLNIIDSKFVKNGAFASNVPFFTDKVYKMQGPYTRCVTKDGEAMSANNGTYLCTWLYAANERNQPVWVDRYYYPDKIEREEALYKDFLSEDGTLTEGNKKNVEKFEQSFENIIDKNYTKGIEEQEGDKNEELIRENTYFDKISDMVLEPQNHYKYSRISTKMVEEVNEKLSANRIEEVENQLGELTYLSDKFVSDNTNWLKIDHSLFNKTNKINFNTDIFIDPSQRMGIQLFGSDYKTGFNIQNRKDLSPFHYYATEKSVYMLNNDFEIRREFNLFEKYSDNIIKLIIGDVFDDIVAISNLYLYVFSWDLRLKTRIYYPDIKDIENLTDVHKLDSKLFGYPYDGTSIDAGIEVSLPNSIALDNNVKLSEVDSESEEYKSGLIFGYDVKDVDISMTSKIAEIFASSNAVIHNNNIYIPYEQDIIKIIFVPDAEGDVFTDEEMQSWPCKARVLGQGEYSLNYVRTGAELVQETATTNGFIQIENKIKNLYFDEADNLYAFNYDKIAMSHDGTTIYGLYALESYINAGGWNWLFNQKLGRLKARVGTSKFAEFGSDESIDFMRMNEYGDMLLVRGFGKASKNEELKKRFEFYDVTKKRQYQFILEDYDKVISVDAYNYITKDDVEKSVFTLLTVRNNKIVKLEYDVNRSGTDVLITDLPIDVLPTFVETTNSDSLIRYANENKLYFNLYLPTSRLYDHKETIVWDISEAQRGWYNINVHIDLDEAKFEVKINDVVYQTISNTRLFEPYVYSNGNVFDATCFVANVGKRFGTTLDRILTDTMHDPYVAKNVKFENMKLYNRTLQYYEYQAMRLEGKPINDISLTLPCGQRTNIEEIVRYFKYNPPSSISNKVKINISGTGLSTQGELKLLEKEIREVLANETDCLIDVKDIEFI